MPDDDFVAFNLVRIKGVQRLSQFMQHVIRCIHDIVLRIDANGTQALLDDVWRGSDLNTFNQQSEVTRASFAGFNRQFKRTGDTGQFGLRGHVHRADFLADAFYGFMEQASPQIARHAEVTHSVRTIGGQSNFQDGVGFQIVHL